jgi:hypothetical protein
VKYIDKEPVTLAQRYGDTLMLKALQFPSVDH